ncbi:MAG: substrate-binding domain-containing protein, partial [Steroidobacter sp.]
MKNTSIWLTVVSLVLSVIIGLTLARGNGESKDKSHRNIVIGLSMDTLKEARWQVDQKIFTDRAAELGATVKVSSANSDDSIQMRDVNSMISDRVDAIVIIPHDGAAMSKAVAAAHSANIPVIAYDRLITDADLDLYVTFDNVKVGEAQAQYLVDAIHGKGKIVRIYGAPTDNNAKLFKQGQDNVLKPYIDRGDIKVIHEDWADNWEPQRAKQITNAAITNHGHDFQAVLASADGVAGGAIQALKEEGLIGKVLVTG